LQSRNRRLVLVSDGDNPATGLQLDVDVDPLAPAALLKEVLHRPVGGDGRGRPEHHLAHIHAHLLVSVDILDDRSGIRAPSGPAIAVELEMGEMSPPAPQRPHGRQSHRRVPWHPQIVAVNVDRMRQSQLVACIGDGLQDGSGRDSVAGQRVIQPVQVPLSRFPCFDPARVHDLDGIASGGADEPCGVVAGPVPLAGGDLA
jgi:hypothetical protein